MTGDCGRSDDTTAHSVASQSLMLMLPLLLLVLLLLLLLLLLPAPLAALSLVALLEFSSVGRIFLLCWLLVRWSATPVPGAAEGAVAVRGSIAHPETTDSAGCADATLTAKVARRCAAAAAAATDAVAASAASAARRRRSDSPLSSCPLEPIWKSIKHP